MTKATHFNQMSPLFSPGTVKKSWQYKDGKIARLTHGHHSESAANDASQPTLRLIADFQLHFVAIATQFGSIHGAGRGR
jgi:hypothetical protein